MRIATKRGGMRPRGLAVVETAVVLPILILLTFAAIKYGWLFYRLQQVTNAARHGARVAIRYGADESDAQKAIRDIMVAAGMGGKYTEPQFSYETTVDANGKPNTAVTVLVQVEAKKVDIIKFKMPGLTEADFTLRGSVTMLKEGP